MDRKGSHIKFHDVVTRPISTAGNHQKGDRYVCVQSEYNVFHKLNSDT